MKIERCGVCRECSEREYENKFKQQGYEIVEDLKKEYTVEELRTLAKENKVKNYWMKKEENLIEELKKVGVL